MSLALHNAPSLPGSSGAVVYKEEGGGDEVPPALNLQRGPQSVEALSGAAAAGGMAQGDRGAHYPHANRRRWGWTPPWVHKH